MRKTKKLQIRLTPNELERLKARAERSGMTMTTYIVYRCTVKPE